MNVHNIDNIRDVTNNVIFCAKDLFCSHARASPCVLSEVWEGSGVQAGGMLCSSAASLSLLTAGSEARFGKHKQARSVVTES